MPRGISYQEDHVKNEAQKLLSKNPARIYSSNVLKWKGKTNDSKQFYTEIIAEEFFKKLNIIQSITIVPRVKSYFNHNIALNGLHKRESSQEEANFAKSLVLEKLPTLGMVFDYQIPISNTRKDGNGKIDIISINEVTNKSYLIELKYFDNDKDTLLTSIMEIYTYSKQCDEKKFLEEIKKLYKKGNAKTKIQPVVLLCEGSLSAKEANEVKNGKRPLLKKLIEILGIEVYVFDFSVHQKI
ncbi:MAG: hypothetical protein A2X64_08840 [Ignavibacteria bacterium GWF2_33_9]|nr:MAG: hypothetical protein A2X64_08840 [Ignavibacteria bacterium GWF2_33_9]